MMVSALRDLSKGGCGLLHFLPLVVEHLAIPGIHSVVKL